MHNATRRRMLLGLSAAGVAVATPLVWLRLRPDPVSHSHAMGKGKGKRKRKVSRFQQPLRLPGNDGLLADVWLGPPLSLQARRARFDVFEDGLATEVWHYAGEVDGRSVANPLLRVTRGAMLDVALQNGLEEDTTIHWHGLSVSEANDGSGLHPVAPGAQASYRFRIDNRAGLYWYHAHPHGLTGRQVQFGMAAPLLIVDDEESALRDTLDLGWCERDLPLFIADKQLDARNAIVYRNGADDWIGNRVLVNWTPEPTHEVLPALYRLRIANACNARLLRLAFAHEGRLLPYHLIGTDGGLLARPWEIEDVFLAPAQRIDVLVDFSEVPPGGRVTMRSLDYVAMENEDESGAFVREPMGDHPGAVPMGAPLDIMQFCVAGCGGDTQPTVSRRARARIPDVLSSLPDPPDARDWPVRKLRLSMDSEGMWFINDHNFNRDGHAPLFTVTRGSREVWEIRNSMTSMPHPMHVHGFQFRILSRSISPQDVRARQVAANGLGPQDLGLSDTVLVWPGEVVRIALDFAQSFRGTQRYMIHCHNLEHEGMGMMATFAVAD